MSETVDIKINLSSEYWDYRYPSVRVYVNDTLLFDNTVSEPTEISWSGNLEETEHNIIIEMYDKQDSDTVTDSDGNIIKDVILNIDEISIDDIDLDRLLWTKSTYRPVNKNAPDKLDECVNLGWNGRWELSFTSPVYLWFLENL